MSATVPILLPTALLALLVFWCGTFQGAAGAPGALGHQVAVLLFCLLAADLRDPLALGRSGRLLLAAALTVVAVSWWFSPVGRAGLVGLVLLPAYLLLPTSTARCWGNPRAHRLGLASVSLLTLSVGVTALIRWQTLSLPRAALPLGHHNLLAGWLVLMLPLTLAAGRFPGPLRWLAIVAGAFSLLTVVATGSLLAAAALAVQAVVAAFWWKRLRFWLVPAILACGAMALPRMLSIARSSDLSTLARMSYIEAGWRGLLIRPTLGWGPGSVPWTVGHFMRPTAGVHPSSQVVGDLHSLPAQLAYEIGVVGMLLALAIAVLFLVHRRREGGDFRESPVRPTAILGLLGGAIFALGSAPLAVPALPATAMVVAGLTLPSQATLPMRHRMPLLFAYILVAATVLWPLDRGHLLYDQARRDSQSPEALRSIDMARELDPGFPLYLARAAWLATEIRGVDKVLADQAHQAAKMAPGLAPLWLAAGDLGRQAQQPWASTALSQASLLDRLSPLNRFHLMTALPAEDDRVMRLAEAVLSTEPRLAAAEWWWRHPAMAQRVSQQLGIPVPQRIENPYPAPFVLALTLDRTPALSFSLFAFRRSPWPGRIAPVALASKKSTIPNTFHPQ